VKDGAQLQARTSYDVVMPSVIVANDDDDDDDDDGQFENQHKTFENVRNHVRVVDRHGPENKHLRCDGSARSSQAWSLAVCLYCAALVSASAVVLVLASSAASYFSGASVLASDSFEASIMIET